MYRTLSVILIIILGFVIDISAQLTSTMPVDQRQEIEKLDRQILIYRNKGELNLAASSLNKIAYLYWNNNQFQKALDYFLESVKINEELGNTNGCKSLYNNIAILYSDIDNCNNSSKYFRKSYDISKISNNKKEQVYSLINIAIANTDCGNYNNALTQLKQSLIIAKELNDLYILRNIYGQMAENYEKLGNSEKSFEFYALFSTFDQHVRDMEQKERELAQQQQLSDFESRTRYAEEMADFKDMQLQQSIFELKRTTDSLQMVEQISEQRKLKLEAQDLALKEKEARLKLAAQFRNTVIVGFLLVLGFSLLVLWLYFQKRKVNALLELHYKQLEAQKDEILDQKHKLEKINIQLQLKNVQILDSITYAKKIQEAILPYEKSIKNRLPESFIFYKPRDIVSGDFYWFSEQDEKLFIAAVDCTGHGVPGAFMSMIGNTLLNEIINEKKYIKPSNILKKLNNSIVHILNQTEDREEVQDDGMDMSLCAIDFENQKVEIACANHYAIVFQNGVYSEIEGDVFTIGGIFAIKKENEFSNHQIDIRKGTTIYMLSDGYQDQFGGEDNRKFMTDNFKDLIKSIQQYPMEQQQSILSETFDTWKGDYKQIDDILVIGLRF
jgi:serine phosphatase RsbU (regulator of sigma subunit)